jgi:uncharacterized protein YjaG (DUF416 family)
MTRKKTKKLNELQYYKWRLSIEKMQHAETKKKLSENKLRQKELEVQNLTLRTNIFRGVVSQMEEEISVFRREYDTIKEEIEKELGVSLNEKIIDEITFEVKELPE